MVARILLSVPVVISAGWLFTADAVTPGEGRLLVLFSDVGQGDATLIKTPAGRWYLFDFGGARNSVGRRPFAYHAGLQAWGVDAIEGGFITHLHRDHFGGAVLALTTYQISRLYTSGERSSDPLALSLDSARHRHNVSVSQLRNGDTLHLDQDVTAYVLAPDRGANAAVHNDRSLVVKVCYGSTSVLLTGDIESESEGQLVRRYGSWLRSTVVKVPHHGSRSSSTKTFVAACDPEHAVISCGARNRFGHPHAVVLQRWGNTGAMIHRTDRSGAIMMESDGHRFSTIDWKQ